MKRTYNSTSLRIDNTLVDGVKRASALLEPQPSVAAFVESCVREILHLIETPPDDRVWPKLVLMCDSARGIQHSPEKVAANIEHLADLLAEVYERRRSESDLVNSPVVQKLAAAVKQGSVAPPAPAPRASGAPVPPVRTGKARPA